MSCNIKECLFNDGKCSDIPYENYCWNCEPVYNNYNEIIDWIPKDNDDE